MDTHQFHTFHTTNYLVQSRVPAFICSGGTFISHNQQHFTLPNTSRISSRSPEHFHYSFACINQRPPTSLLPGIKGTSYSCACVSQSNMSAFIPLPMTFSGRRFRIPFGRRRHAERSTSPSSSLTPNSTPLSPRTNRRTIRLSQANINWPALSRRANDAISQLTPTKDPITREAELRECVDNDSTNPFLWHALAKHVGYVENDVETAIRLLSEAVRTVPVGSRGGLFEAWGSFEVHRGNIDLALRIYTDAIRTDAFSSLFISLAITQAKLHLFDEARKTFERGTLAFPSNAPLWRAWATFESKNGNLAAALERWREAVEKDPTNARAWQMLVFSEQKCGASQAHVGDILHEALVSCPEDCKLRLQLARIEEKRRGLPVARSILAGVEDQDDPDVLRYIARLCFDTGDPAAGRHYFRRAVDVEKSMENKSKKRRKKKYSAQEPYIRSLHAWALLETREGNLQEARDVLYEAKAVCSGDAGIWRALGEIESRDRNYEKARDAFETAHALDPDDYRVTLAWGRSERLAGNLEKAEELMTQLESFGLSSEPRSAPTFRGSSESSFRLETQSYKAASAPSGKFGEKRTLSLTPSVLAAALRERATIASRDGRFKDARRLLTRACQIEPISETGWRLLAAQELRINGMREVRKVYEKGMKCVDPRGKPKLLHWWGQDERSNGDIDRARDLFRRATVANPDYMSAWMSWALLEKSEGELEMACSIFEQAVERAEADLLRAPFIFQAWGRIEELDCGRPEFAAEIFNRGVQLVPRSGPLLSAWGLLEQRRGNIERARELFQKATVGDPTYGSTWHSWALLESTRCNYDRAAELFGMGIENDPTNSALLVSWATMEGNNLKNVKRANELFESAISVDPMFATAWQEWGHFEMNCGNIEQAREFVSKALKLRSNDPSCWHSLGVLDGTHCKQLDSAVKNWKQAIAICPSHVESYISWAYLEAKEKGNMEEARRIFERSLQHVRQKSTDSSVLLQSWGSLEHSSGNIENAHDLFSKALDEDCRHAKTWECLAEIEKLIGNRDRAKQLLKDGIEVAAPASSTAPLLVMLGMMKAEDGEVDHARTTFTKAVRANPSREESWRAFVKMESKYGSVRQAEEVDQTANSLFIRG